MKKRYICIGLGIIIISILAIIVVPKYLVKGDKKVKFSVLETSEVPERIKEVLPQYLADERALGCRVGDEIYVVVTRGEKQTGGYTVEVEGISEKKTKDDGIHLTVHVKFNDPDVNDIVMQGFSYPFTIVKTNLNQMPEKIQLEVVYEEED